MLKSPAIRLTIAMVLLSINLLFLAELLGFVPDTNKSALELRKSLCESLALQFSAAAEKGEFLTIQKTLRAVVERNGEIRSAAIRTNDGKLVALAGEHLAYWRAPVKGRSTPTQVQVPVFLKSKNWATVELRFAPLWTGRLTSGFANSFIGLLAFFGLSGFCCYFFVIKRTLRVLDPAAVIPERVQKAFNVFQEGILILDENEQIVMSNIAFADLFDKSPSEMIGRKGSELGWLGYRTPRQINRLPWIKALQDGNEHTGTMLTLLAGSGSKIKLRVNVAVVSDSAGKSRGTLLTFDDITQLEEKNFELNHMIDQLQVANDEIEQQSRELKVLADCDPLTLCLNRRALGLRFDTLFNQAKANGTPLSCLMVDIDFFKSVNDRYGHATGDQVIQTVADVLKTCTRDSDLIGRYGGEEFCVILPDIALEPAAAVAERIRRTIEAKTCSGVKITASLGASTIDADTGKPDDLINQADKALYAAKESGRNRVIVWGEDLTTVTPEEDAKQIHAPVLHEETSISKETEQAQLQRRVVELEGLLEKRNQQLEYYELYDFKTGLPTRSLFEDRIAHEMARSKRQSHLVAVLSMTIGAVRRIQKAYGYNSAEQLVQACGHRLNDVLRENIDMVAAVNYASGQSTVSLIDQTEFGILLTDIRQVDHVTWVMKRILDAFEKPFLIKGHEIYTPAFFGVSIFPHDGQTVEELYTSATNACHHAQKLNGNDRYIFSSRKLNEMAVSQLKIENALYVAVQNEELELYYQPKIEAATGRVAGYEALLRWHHKHMGYVPPDQFVPIAEQSGQIDRIGDWVIYNACRQLRIWKDMELTTGPIAVNMSSVQLRQQNLADRILSILAEFNIKPNELEIELTESALIKTYDQSFPNLEKFKKMGLPVTMDDFGTGYSSLAYLRKMPLSGMKIDRSFVSDINRDETSHKLIACMASIAQGLGLEITAEGVEKKYQADHLIALGCHYLQGYYYGRPMPQAEVTGILQTKSLAMAG